MSAFSSRSLLSSCVLACLLATLHAQQAPASRVLQAVDDNLRITLPGNTHPLARPEFDQGEAPADLPMKRMLLVLKRSPEQDSALLSLLDSQQAKRSPNYHRWLTPKEFGTRFGPSDSDVATVTNWLKSSGFQVADPSAGRTVIEFSGTASLVQAAFHTAIHKYVVKGKEHWANSNDPQIPAALEPVVAGVHSLHNFFKRPLLGQIKRVPATFSTGPVAHATFAGGVHALAPLDYAKIYNIGPAYSAGFTGTGVTIAIVARSEFDGIDLGDFYNILGISRTAPQIIFDGDTPWRTLDEAEAILDVSWASALAPGAAIDFVIAASTNTTDGVDLAEIYIVDHNLADIMTESFGSCEAAHTSTEATTVAVLAEEAAAQGITYTVSTGDSGAEGCDPPTQTSAQGPVSASLAAATPFNIAVGGTMFHEGTGNYWGPANGVNPTALSYIPENVWNESCAAGTCAQGQPPLGAGGGGASQFFAKPSWQAGVPGIPNDGARDQPDVSLTASQHDGYIVCFASSCSSTNNSVYFFSGTSASAPSFAAIMALVDQKAAAVNPTLGPRQGQANYVLYRLAAADVAAGRKCNASGTTLPASTCNFNDVTVGNNAVPGEAGFGTASGKYQSTVGYDLATGLGSVNVNNLVNNWASATFTPSTTTLTSLSPTTLTHGATVNVHVNVTPSAATGDVSLRNGDAPQVSGSGLIDAFNLMSGGSVVSTTNLLPGGTYHVIAHYAGDGTFAPSDSGSPGISVTVTPEPSNVALAVSDIDSAGNIIPYGTQPYGSIGYLRADVSGASGKGTPTGMLTFSSGPGGTFHLNSQGTATTTQGYADFAPGSYSISAHYAGDASFSANASSATVITVTKAATTNTVTSSSSTVPEGSTVALTATLTSSSYGVNGPVGSVTFLSGGVPVNPVGLTTQGGAIDLQNNASAKATAAATLTTILPVGAHTIAAQYPGDGNYLASTSTPITVTVAADFDFTPATTPITVSRGSSGTATLTIAGHTGYTGTVNFTGASCTGLPAESTCSFTPPSVAGSGTTMVSIKTTAPKTASLTPLNFWASGSAGIFAGLFLLGTASRRRRWSSALALLVLASLTTIVGCGGGGSSGPPPDPGTPLGTFPVTVKAADSTGVLSHTVTVTLTVQ